MQVSKEAINSIPPGQLVIATTGAQGEPMSGLARMANRDHRFVEIQPGDTVIISASPIPGNEEYVSRTIDNLFKAGANVYYHEIRRAHVSGHASQEELKLMLGLTKPRYFIPIHGEFRMQVQHGRLAVETGVAPDNVFIIENGMPIEILPDGSARRGTAVPAGYVYVDGLSVGEVGDVVLRDRRALANDGMFVVVVEVDKQTGNVVGRPEIITRGFVAGNENEPLIQGAIQRIIDAIENPGDHISEIALLKSPDQGRRVALPVRADEAPAHGLPRRRGGLTPAMAPATAQRPLAALTARSTSRRKSGGLRASRGPQWQLSPGRRPLAGRDRAAGHGRRHAHRPRPARPGPPHRPVARLDRTVVRHRVAGSCRSCCSRRASTSSGRGRGRAAGSSGSSAPRSPSSRCWE